jgi:hypothetical protein
MNYESFKSWLDAYGCAWENRNPELIIKIFTKDAIYHEIPLDPPICGIDAIEKYWANIPQTQENVKFKYEILSVTDRYGIAQWNTNYVSIRTGEEIKMDGIFVIQLDDSNKCEVLREWWHAYP